MKEVIKNKLSTISELTITDEHMINSHEGIVVLDIADLEIVAGGFNTSFSSQPETYHVARHPCDRIDGSNEAALRFLGLD